MLMFLLLVVEEEVEQITVVVEGQEVFFMEHLFL
jgi:hypothetical protein